MLKIVSAIVLAIMTFSASAHETAKRGVMFDHPWIRATAPNAMMAAGYFKLTNGGFEDDRLISASANFSEKVEIHETIKDGDVSKMRAIAGGIVVPQEAEFLFEPGGMHLMFRGLKQQMVAGETFDVEMQFEHAGMIMVEFLVEKAGKRHHNHSENMKLGSGQH